MTEPNLAAHLEHANSSEAERRRFAQNSLIVDTAVVLNKALESAGINQKEMAVRLGRSQGFVSQILNGGGNLTLRTLADFAYNVGCAVEISVRPADVASLVLATKTQTSWTSTAIHPAKETAADTQLALAA